MKTARRLHHSGQSERKCIKCKEVLPAAVIPAGDAFGRDRFKVFYVHKFRARFRENRLLSPGEKVPPGRVWRELRPAPWSGRSMQASLEILSKHCLL